LSIEEKKAMADIINLTYTAFVSIEEVALNQENPFYSNSSDFPLQLRSSSLECRYDWNQVIDSMIQGMVFGGIGSAFIGGTGGLVLGFGLASPLTGPLGALAGANLGAMAGGVEEFTRSAIWEAIKYLICLAGESSEDK
jgi:hypothetical protein